MIQPPSTQITLLLLIDALRPDYLAHAPYLRSLSANSATGVFREGFGFVPRQAYFGGLTAEQFGFTGMYCFDPARSPFGVAWGLPRHEPDSSLAELPGTRQFVDASARDRLTPFARTYATSINIPLAYLPYFDLVEQRAPWDPHVGYRSCFAILNQHHVPWYQCMWPDTNRLPDHTDAGIVQTVLSELRPEHRLACVHLQELDGLGHAYGPSSPELLTGITATDQHCRRMIDSVRERYDRLKIILFGDHGMVNVTSTLDIAAVLRQTGLTFGVDYAYFLDSSMARFWFYHGSARTRLEAALGPLSGGHVLTEHELKRYGIANCDRRNGEVFFLADPGVLIFPNFFQVSGAPPRGMHGYDPDCPDNFGFFLMYDPGRPHLAGRSVGKVDPPMLFPLLLESIGIAPSHYTAVRSPESDPRPQPLRRFTCHEAIEAETLVQTQLRRVLGAVTQLVGDTEATVLTGSFGRGEGGVYRDVRGELRPVNDYDLIIVDQRDLSIPLKNLGDVLAKDIGIDFVDLAYSDGRWENLPLTVFSYDLKYGSQVIAGDPSVLDRIPAYASADLPPYEAVKLLLNRTAGLLSGLRGDFLRGQSPTADERRYLTNQAVKALMAIGDGYLMRWKGYDSSYAMRRQRFASLAPGAGITHEIASIICRAYDFKCHPDYTQFTDGLQEIRGFYPALEMALLDSINILTENHDLSVTEALSHYLAFESADKIDVRADNERCLANPTLHGMVKPNGPAVVSLRHLIYAVLPLLLKSAVTDASREAFCLAQQHVQAGFDIPAEKDFSPTNWETLRAQMVTAWFAVCH